MAADLNDPFAVILYLEATYTAAVRAARMDASLSSKLRQHKEAHCQGALEALGETRRLFMEPWALPCIAEHVVEVSKDKAQV